MIDYEVLNHSISFYESKGFKRIESPWLVSEEINNITKPKNAKSYYVTKNNKTKTFVASGEQSFLYLINKGFLPEGKYQTITPCMRDDNFDQWHTKYFMKNELIQFGGILELDYFLDSAIEFFKSMIVHQDRIQIEGTSEGFDLNYVFEDKKVEMGSYGIRECEFCNWVYGTGVAEPRFSNILRHFEGIS